MLKCQSYMTNVHCSEQPYNDCMRLVACARACNFTGSNRKRHNLMMYTNTLDDSAINKLSCKMALLKLKYVPGAEPGARYKKAEANCFI